jgi:hypothetical protein
MAETCVADEDVEGLWEWAGSGKKLTYADWYPGEPNNIYQNKENCLILYNGEKYHWNDFPCWVAQHFICEKR